MAFHIDVAAGSVTGRDHRRMGKNNQDAWAWTQFDHLTVAVLSDGCGSSPHSEVGAQVAVQLTVKALERQLSQGSWQDGAFWPGVERQLLAGLRSLAHRMNGSFPGIVQDYLMCTLLGAVITPEETTIFGLGDGVYVLNGEIFSLGPFAGNAPPYLAHQLLPDRKNLSQLRLQVHLQCPTVKVQTLLLGSDGVTDLIAAATLPLPGKAELVGDLSQFWQDSYFQNPDRVRRRLSLINREVILPDWEKHQLNRHPGLLPDDTTLVSLRLRPGA